MASKLSAKTLFDLVKSTEDYKVNPELGVSLDEVVHGGAEYRTYKRKMKKSFFSFLKKDTKYALYMKNVRYNKVVVPRIVIACNPDTEGSLQSKCKVVNEMLTDFAATMKLKNPPKEGCPYLQPSTQCQYLRTLLAGMRDDYGWDYTLDSSFNFKGGVKAVVDQLFEKRRRDFPEVSFLAC